MKKMKFKSRTRFYMIAFNQCTVSGKIIQNRSHAKTINRVYDINSKEHLAWLCKVQQKLGAHSFIHNIEVIEISEEHYNFIKDYDVSCSKVTTII